MISFADFQEIFATSFLDGDMAIAGILIYAAVMIIIFAVTKNTTHSLLISLPITLVFSMLNILSTDLMILLIIVTVLGLAFTTKGVWRT